METEPKERLHHLVDALPESELVAAQPYLEFLLRLGYPYVQTLLNAPKAAGPQTEGHRETLAERRRAFEEGNVVSDPELRTDLGISRGSRSGLAPLSET